MSLDIYLTLPACEHCGSKGQQVASRNVTHNLGKMAREAGVYEALWRPTENGLKLAGDLIAPLEAGIANLRSRPEHFKQFNPENGWGSYDDFVPWLESLLEVCREYPMADVGTWR